MQEYTLNDLTNSCRGELAEVLANHVLHYTHRVKGKDKGFLDQEFPFLIPSQMTEFLKEHWTRMDLFKFHVAADTMKCAQLELFEVKARKKKWVNPKNSCFTRYNITRKTIDLYRKARALGFLVTLVEVHFSDSWNFTVRTSPLFSNTFNVAHKLHPKEIHKMNE